MLINQANILKKHVSVEFSQIEIQIWASTRCLCEYHSLQSVIHLF